MQKVREIIKFIQILASVVTNKNTQIVYCATELSHKTLDLHHFFKYPKKYPVRLV